MGLSLARQLRCTDVGVTCMNPGSQLIAPQVGFYASKWPAKGTFTGSTRRPLVVLATMVTAGLSRT
jgi:hypothetical protein